MAVDYQRNHRKIYQNTFRFAKLQFYKSTKMYIANMGAPI